MDDGTSCALTDIVVTLRITFEYPELATPASGATAEWEGFMRGTVVPHEEHHRDLALQGAADLLRGLEALEPAADCATLDAQAQEVARQIKDDTAERQDSFDASVVHP